MLPHTEAGWEVLTHELNPIEAGCRTERLANGSCPRMLIEDRVRRVAAR
jgi:hypothetical protein